MFGILLNMDTNKPFNEAEYEALVAQQRAAQSRSLTNALTRATQPQMKTTAPQTLGLANLLERGRSAAGDQAHFPAGMDTPSGVYRQVPAVVGSFRLDDAHPAPSAIQARQLDKRALERTTTAGGVYTMAAAVMNSSRVLQAGVRLIHAVEPHQVGDMLFEDGKPVGPKPITWSSKPARFEVIRPVPFTLVADGVDVAVSELNISSAEVTWAEEASHALHFSLTRREMKSRSTDDQEFILSRTIAASIGQAIDRIVLTAMTAQALTAFSIGKVAARSLRVSDLAALCGTAGTAASFADDGGLRVAGLKADTTEAITESVVFVPGHVAVCVDPEIRVVLKRTSIAGDLEATVFMSIQPLFPTGANDAWLAA